MKPGHILPGPILQYVARRESEVPRKLLFSPLNNKMRTLRGIERYEEVLGSVEHTIAKVSSDLFNLMCNTQK